MALFSDMISENIGEMRFVATYFIGVLQEYSVPSTINVLLDISVTQTTEKVQAQCHKPVQSLIKPKLWKHYCVFALWLVDLTHIGSLCN